MLGNKRGKKLEEYVQDYVVFDLETTGISTVHDAVIEISALRVKAGQIAAEFNTLVNPGRPIPGAASQVNGITDQMVQSAPPFQQALREFLAFAGDNVLVGHNIHSFDLKFLYRDAERFWGQLPDNDYVDTLPLARSCLPQLSSYKLVDLAEFYGISSQGAHRALQDCHMNQQVFEHLAQEIGKRKNNAAEGKICPRCGGILKRRNGKYGAFWGCSRFPQCRYTENMEVKK